MRGKSSIFVQTHLDMKRFLLMLAAYVTCVTASAQVSIHVQSEKPSGTIDPMLYGQLFEHIYFSANNGVWQELIYERSFEPEHYPGIPPRDGYFDGWFMDDDAILHSRRGMSSHCPSSRWIRMIMRLRPM